MSMDTWNSTAVDKFLKLTQTARSYNSKEVRMSIQDADALALSLAMILNKEKELITKVMMLQDRLLAMSSNSPTQVNLNGGGF